MPSAPLPTLRFYEFYLIKSIKMGNRFKDFGSLSFSLQKLLENSNILGLMIILNHPQQNCGLLKGRDSAVLISLSPESGRRLGT